MFIEDFRDLYVVQGLLVGPHFLCIGKAFRQMQGDGMALMQEEPVGECKQKAVEFSKKHLRIARGKQHFESEPSKLTMQWLQWCDGKACLHSTAEIGFAPVNGCNISVCCAAFARFADTGDLKDTAKQGEQMGKEEQEDERGDEQEKQWLRTIE